MPRHRLRDRRLHRRHGNGGTLTAASPHSPNPYFTNYRISILQILGLLFYKSSADFASFSLRALCVEPRRLSEEGDKADRRVRSEPLCRLSSPGRRPLCVKNSGYWGWLLGGRFHAETQSSQRSMSRPADSARQFEGF